MVVTLVPAASWGGLDRRLGALMLRLRRNPIWSGLGGKKDGDELRSDTSDFGSPGAPKSRWNVGTGTGME